jgi:ABC-2 type transport system ATP-binding protein
MILIKEVSKNYINTVALDSVNLIIQKGSILGLLGPNGAGKTTLIRILTGIIASDLGQVTINDEPLNKINVKKIGYLPEERGLYKKMKVGEQAVYLAVLKGISHHEAEKKLKQWFEKMDISNWWNKKVETLSKGMQQKIQFIISVIHQPDLLILDEPFSGLDPINREILGNEILELNKSGMTIVLSTHDMNSVEQFCDQAVLIDKGRVLLSGKVTEIKQARKSFLYEFCFKKNEELFINQCNLLESKIVFKDKNDAGFCIKLQLKNEQEVEILLAQTIDHISLTSFREILPSMHDIFIESVGKIDTKRPNYE